MSADTGGTARRCRDRCVLAISLALLTSLVACGSEPVGRDRGPAETPQAAPAPGRGDSPPQPAAPTPPPQPAVYESVEDALTKAGLKVCSFTGYGENQDYAYLQSRHYYVSKGACLPNRPPVEGNPRFGTVRVEIYLNRGTLQRGVSAHEGETRYDRPVSGAAWILDEALIEVPQYLHPAMAQAVARALRAAGAQRKYFRF